METQDILKNLREKKHLTQEELTATACCLCKSCRELIIKMK